MNLGTFARCVAVIAALMAGAPALAEPAQSRAAPAAEASGGFDPMAVLNFLAGGPDAKPFGGMPQEKVDEAVRQGLQLGMGMAARQGLVRPGEDGRPQIGQFPANALPAETKGGGAAGKAAAPATARK